MFEMVKVLLLGLTADQNFIEVDHRELVDEQLKHMRHDSHERTKGIGEPKQLVFVLKSFPFIAWANADLMVATPQINLGENRGTCHHVKHVA